MDKIVIQTHAPAKSMAVDRQLRETDTSKVISVTYHDGAPLTFLFDRTTLIADLAAMISRAGRVRKVVL